jgi:lipoate-protein ligase A
MRGLESAGELSLNVCHLLIDPPATGAWNMAVDELLLADAADRGLATLRFYRWSEPTLSLGYFQRFADREQHAASRGSAVVRRQTGGGAILHDRELTYSLALPAWHPLARTRQGLYRLVHQIFIDALKPYLTDAKRQCTLHIRGDLECAPPEKEPFLCFQRSAPGDLLLVHCRQAIRSDYQHDSLNGAKILGSAQRRVRGAILQHGSLIFKTSLNAPEILGIEELAGVTIPFEPLAKDAAIHLTAAMGLAAQVAAAAEITDGGLIEELFGKYQSAARTRRR